MSEWHQIDEINIEQLENVSIDDFACYILPAAPLNFIERLSKIKLDDGWLCDAKEMAKKEIASRKHEKRVYTGLEPMDKYLEESMLVKFNKDVIPKDTVRWNERNKSLVYIVFDHRAEMVGILEVIPSVLRQYGPKQ